MARNEASARVYISLEGREMVVRCGEVKRTVQLADHVTEAEATDAIERTMEGLNPWQAGWLTTHGSVEVRLTTATEGPPVSFRVSYDDGKPEPQPETEGQRLARFFATSAHKGHERQPPTWEQVKARVSWPQSKRIAFGDIVYGVQYVEHADPRAVIDRDGEPWCTVWGTHITSDVDPGHPIIVEAQGALRVLAAALKQEWER